MNPSNYVEISDVRMHSSQQEREIESWITSGNAPEDCELLLEALGVWKQVQKKHSVPVDRILEKMGINISGDRVRVMIMTLAGEDEAAIRYQGWRKSYPADHWSRLYHAIMLTSYQLHPERVLKDSIDLKKAKFIKKSVLGIMQRLGIEGVSEEKVDVIVAAAIDEILSMSKCALKDADLTLNGLASTHDWKELCVIFNMLSRKPSEDANASESSNEAKGPFVTYSFLA